MSRSATRATCGLMLARLGERFDAIADVTEPDIHREHSSIQLAGFLPFSLLLQRAAQPVENPEALLIARGRQLEGAPQNGFRHRIGALVEKAPAQRFGRPQLAVG